MRARKVVLWAGAAAVVVVAGVVGTNLVVHRVSYGAEFTESKTGAESRTAITVDKGDRFSIVVRDNASIGDDWSLRDQPDQAVATLDGDEYTSDTAWFSEPAAGSGGKRYFTFTAQGSGSTSIVLLNCFRCGSAQESKDSYAATFEVTVR
jgi:predicted secreted protein